MLPAPIGVRETDDAVEDFDGWEDESGVVSPPADWWGEEPSAGAREMAERVEPGGDRAGELIAAGAARRRLACEFGRRLCDLDSDL